MKSFYAISFVLFGMVLAACGSEQIAAQRAAEANKQYQAAMVDCRNRFPLDEPKTIVAKMQCGNSAFAVYIMPALGGNQDLGQQWMAARASVGEQIQNGKITDAQGAVILTEKWSALISEAQRRNAVAQTAAAQQNAANAAQAAADWQAFGNALAAANLAYAAGMQQGAANLGTHCTTRYVGNSAYTDCY